MCQTRWGGKRKSSSSERKSMEQKSRGHIVRPFGPAPLLTLDRNPGMGWRWALERLGGSWAGKLYYSTLHGGLQKATPITDMMVPVQHRHSRAKMAAHFCPAKLDREGP